MQSLRVQKGKLAVPVGRYGTGACCAEPGKCRDAVPIKQRRPISVAAVEMSEEGAGMIPGWRRNSPFLQKFCCVIPVSMDGKSNWKARGVATEFWLATALVAGSFVAGLIA